MWQTSNIITCVINSQLVEEGGIAKVNFESLRLPLMPQVLVLAEEKWMRIIDGRLEDQGIFIGSKTKKYLVDPELGIIPQLPPEP